MRIRSFLYLFAILLSVNLFQAVSLARVPQQQQPSDSNNNGFYRDYNNYPLLSKQTIQHRREKRQLHYFDPPPFYQYLNMPGQGDIHNCAGESFNKFHCRPLSRILRVRRSTGLQLPENYGRRPQGKI